jgi:hypothetical protein
MLNRGIGVMRLLLLIAMTMAGATLPGCSSDSDGTCAGGSSPVICYTGYDKSRCESMNSRQVNGGSWSYSSDACDERGYTKTCHNSSANYDFYVSASASCP